MDSDGDYGGRRRKKMMMILAAAAGMIVIAGVAAAVLTQEEPGPQKHNEKIGLVINTPNQHTSLQELNQIYSEAAATGIGRSNVYLFWNAVEPAKGQFDWEQPDILMSFNKTNDLKVTLYFSVINGKTLGPFPDWIGRPSLNSINEDHLFNVLDAVLSRYDIVDTVVMAGETESHFRYSEQNIPVYRELFTGIYDRLKDRHPDVKVGNAFALHHVLNKNLGHIVTELAVGDFVGFTYFPVDSLNDIVKTPGDARGDLKRALELVPGKKAGFMEVGWSTSDFVGGSEPDQSTFVKDLLGFYSENEPGIEFVTWYRQYDRPADTCAAGQQQQRPPGAGPGIGSGDSGGDSSGLVSSSEHVIERLNHYICKSGMISADGSPKPGWGEFRAQLKAVS